MTHGAVSELQHIRAIQRAQEAEAEAEAEAESHRWHNEWRAIETRLAESQTDVQNISADFGNEHARVLKAETRWR